MKRTKIVATIGPASQKQSVMKRMIKSGLNVARLNFSHNVHKHHLMLIKRLRQVAKSEGVGLAILQDLQGPRIRIGDVGETGIKIRKGQKLTISYSDQPADTKVKPVAIPVHYKNISKDLKPGEMVLVEDGLIRLEVEKVENKKVHCKVLVAGVIKTHKGMNFPDSNLSASAMTEKDFEDLEFGIKNRVDFVALSFVKDAKDITQLRKRIANLEKRYIPASERKSSRGTTVTKIIAKIERKDAVNNFSRILKAVDGIMVARGDLGIELPFEDVPLIQKDIIKKCNYAGKPVIVATQMLDSMIRNPIPTRAEVSDVANAILDGTDAIMLSGESATGVYPVEAVKAMKRIAAEVEPIEFEIQQGLDGSLKKINLAGDFVSYNAQNMAEQLKVKAIICLSESGDLARKIVRYKSQVPLYVFSAQKPVVNQMSLSWGASGLLLRPGDDLDKTMGRTIAVLRKNKKVRKNQTVLFCADKSYSYLKRDNFIRVEKA
jgi:pyruvate kinase